MTVGTTITLDANAAHIGERRRPCSLSDTALGWRAFAPQRRTHALGSALLGRRRDIVLNEPVAATAPDWVFCAGYMRILDACFVRRFQGRLLNVHPSLLPRYKGLHTHARALQAGDTEHGASVHFVVPALDAGAVVAQAPIPILPGDSPPSLAERLLPHEHRLVVAVMVLACSGRLARQAGQMGVVATARLGPRPCGPGVVRRISQNLGAVGGDR